MKVLAHVAAVREDGSDELVIGVLGHGAGQATWVPALRFEVRVQNTVQARRTFHVGRLVTITVEPR